MNEENAIFKPKKNVCNGDKLKCNTNFCLEVDNILSRSLYHEEDSSKYRRHSSPPASYNGRCALPLGVVATQSIAGSNAGLEVQGISNGEGGFPKPHTTLHTDIHLTGALVCST